MCSNALLVESAMLTITTTETEMYTESGRCPVK